MSVPFYSSSRGLALEAPALRTYIESLETGKDEPFLVAELEAEIRRRTGAKHAISCNSGTDALIALLLAAGIGPGDEVIVPGYSFFASASCVVHAGATPVFVDIDPTSYAITADTVRKSVTERTAAVLVVHLFHTMADMAPLRDLCNERGLLLLEDSAEAIGMSQGGVHAGLFGSGGVLSFFPTKTWGGLGDAGAVITDDDDIAHAVRSAFEGDSAAAWVSRADGLQAATLLTKVRRLDADIARRAEVAKRYTAALAGLDEVQVPKVSRSSLPQRQVWYVYLVEAERRDGLAAHLAAQAIETEIYYPQPLNTQPCFGALGQTEPLPVATQASLRALGLPLYADITDADVDEVCAAIHDYYRGTTRA